MREIDGVCYADALGNEKRILEAVPQADGMLLVVFSTGEKRVFDTMAVSGSAFAPLREGTAQQTVSVEHGFVSWLDGEIDLAPEYIYEHSQECVQPTAA